MRLVRDAGELADVILARFRESNDTIRNGTGSEFIIQPFIAGQTLSVSAIVSPDRERIDVFPVGRQRLSDDGAFAYLGGRIPEMHVDAQRVRNLVCRAVRSIPGLHGYVGIDLIQGCNGGDEIIVCEINPRLTTSYLGYRALTEENLAERLLFPDRDWKPIAWKAGTVAFTPEGCVEDDV
jgi:predicted ATP-grasp superfamily ATP-dependent carboligase